jgi:hypothetical protein
LPSVASRSSAWRIPLRASAANYRNDHDAADAPFEQIWGVLAADPQVSHSKTCRDPGPNASSGMIQSTEQGLPAAKEHKKVIELNEKRLVESKNRLRWELFVQAGLLPNARVQLLLNRPG